MKMKLEAKFIIPLYVVRISAVTSWRVQRTVRDTATRLFCIVVSAGVSRSITMLIHDRHHKFNQMRPSVRVSVCE